MDPPRRRALIDQAKTSSAYAELRRMADQNLAHDPSNSWRTLGNEHRETIIYRLLAGEMLGAICREMGIEPGIVRSALYYDEEFGHSVVFR